MIKTLRQVGNSLGLVIEKPILELLKIDQNTPLEVSTDGVNLYIRPRPGGHAERVRAASERVIKNHEKGFRKLAE